MKSIYIFGIFDKNCKESVKDKFYIVVGEDAVESAMRLCNQIGIPEDSHENFSVLESFNISDCFDLSILWPIFTNNPPAWCLK